MGTFKYPHDLGYTNAASAIDITERPLEQWELHLHALLVILSTAKPQPLMTTDELRRGVEALDEHTYSTWTYYERWAHALSACLTERGVITSIELYQELGLLKAQDSHHTAAFTAGQRVRIRKEDPTVRFKKPHLRVPGYVFGLSGEVVRCVGKFPDPGLLAFRLPAPSVQLYVVRIRLKDIEESRYYKCDGQTGVGAGAGAEDVVEIEVYEPWLEALGNGTGNGNGKGKDKSGVFGSSRAMLEDALRKLMSSKPRGEAKQQEQEVVAAVQQKVKVKTKKMKGKKPLPSPPMPVTGLLPPPPAPRPVPGTKYGREAHAAIQDALLSEAIFKWVCRKIEAQTAERAVAAGASLKKSKIDEMEYLEREATRLDKWADGPKRREDCLAAALATATTATATTATTATATAATATAAGGSPNKNKVPDDEKKDGHDGGHDHKHDHDHDHGHGQGGHSHLGRSETERAALDKEFASLGAEDRPGRRMADALLALLRRKGVVTAEQLAGIAERLEGGQKDLRGADLVVEAWTNPTFKEELLRDAQAAAQKLNIVTSNPNAPTLLVVCENTPETHHVIVCTLCSCYPSSLLGLSPAWYKSASYRSRVVREPRQVLREAFGTDIPSTQRIVVHDSTADCRYMVLPIRPPGSEMLEKAALRALVTRDSLIGVRVLSV